MPQHELEQALRDLPRIGALVDYRPGREIWGFDFAGRPYLLHFYMAGDAMRDFRMLQDLQKASVPSPRAVAVLVGYTLRDRKGDALIVEATDSPVRLDHLLLDTPNLAHRDLAIQMIALLEKLGQAHLGLSNPHPGSFVVSGGRLMLAGPEVVLPGGLRMEQLLKLALSLRPWTTRADLLRAWRALQPADDAPPDLMKHARAIWRKSVRATFKESSFFGHLRTGPWTGYFFRQTDSPRAWSLASRRTITRREWEDVLPSILAQLASDQLEVLKGGPSGAVYATEVVLGGKPLPIVIKHPDRRYWWRYVTEIGRGTRPRRAWRKAWHLIYREIPTAWPLVLLEKRVLGYAVDAMIIFERIGGKMLNELPWLKDDPQRFRLLLHRTGRLLGRVEETGLYFYDSKAVNWMVVDDEAGPHPMLIDVDSIRPIQQGGGLRRLLRSLREDPGIRLSDADAHALVRGYDPFARPQRIAELTAMGQPRKVRP